MNPTEKPKRKRGRPFGTTKPADQVASVKFNFKLTPKEKESLMAAGGGTWIRKKINELLKDR